MVVVDDAEQGWHRLQLMVRRSSIKQLDDSTTKTPDIRSSGSARQFDDFRRHPIGCTHYATLMQTGILSRRNTKIGQLNQTFFGSENVRAFDVSVNNTLFMKVQQTIEDLGHVQSNKIFGKLAKVLADGM